MKHFGSALAGGVMLALAAAAQSPSANNLVWDSPRADGSGPMPPRIFSGAKWCATGLDFAGRPAKMRA